MPQSCSSLDTHAYNTKIRQSNIVQPSSGSFGEFCILTLTFINTFVDTKLSKMADEKSNGVTIDNILCER